MYCSTEPSERLLLALADVVLDRYDDAKSV
jgi:hypothetical protein